MLASSPRRRGRARRRDGRVRDVQKSDTPKERPQIRQKGLICGFANRWAEGLNRLPGCQGAMLVLLPAPVRAVWLWWRPFFDRLGRNRPFNTTTFRLRMVAMFRLMYDTWDTGKS